jgi:HEAT repeat protein
VAAKKDANAKKKTAQERSKEHPAAAPDSGLSGQLKSSNVEIRKKAVADLARDTGNPASIGLLVQALADDNETIVMQAMKALTEAEDRAIPALIAALKNPSWTIRKNSSKVLVRLGDRSLREIVAAMRSDDEDVQFWAGEVLSEFGEKALDSFLDLLKRGSQSNKICAINALGKTGSPKAVMPMIDQLGADSWSVRKAAAEALWEIGEPAVDPLVKCLASENPDVQYWAIQVLGEIGDTRAVAPIIKKLKDENQPEEKRISCIKALGEIEDPAAIQALIEQLGNNSWFVRRAAGEALWQIGPAAVGDLIRALAHGNVDVRYWSSKVLGEMQAKEAVEPLIRLLEDKEWSIRSGAAYSLGEIGDERAAEALLKYLEDPNEIVRKNVVIALGQIGDSKAIKSSEQALEDESEWVRRYAAETLEKIKDKRLDQEYAKKKHCRKCKAVVEAAWKFCAGCGEALRA